MAKKESGDALSSDAAMVLSSLGDVNDEVLIAVPAGFLKAVCGSVLSQDETKGKRPRGKTKKARS